MKGDSLSQSNAAHADRIHKYEVVESEFVATRRVDVWLPSGYDSCDRHYPVIYAQDGQNLFDPSTSFVGVHWALNDAITRLSQESDGLAAIVVGIWNTSDRVPEYMPEKPLMSYRNGRVRERFAERYGNVPMSDDYLQFMATELKPRIDKAFRTRSDPASTVLLGSSMGGLLSLYGYCEYPNVFGNAVCMSTSWTIAGNPVIAYLREHIPEPGDKRVYFDYGSEAQIAAYEKLQHEVDRLFYRKGYRRDIDFMVQRFPGDPHSEDAWRDRVEVPLRFILNRRPWS